MRIEAHPILEFKREKSFNFFFEGEEILAYEDEPIAAALHAEDITTLSHSLRFHRHRGFFCAIGKCSSCLMEVDGIPNIRICVEPAKEGSQVKLQSGRGVLPDIKFSDLKFSDKTIEWETEIAIIGAGPSGLSAAIYAAKLGAKVLVIDDNFQIGGQLIKQTHMFFGSKEHYARIRGVDIGDKLLEQLEKLGVKIETGTTAIGFYPPDTIALIKDNKLIRLKTKKTIIATGASENMLAFHNCDLPGVYGAGAVQTLMNVYGIVPGKRVLMIGAGNIGVIVSYQLLQAGVEVIAVVEAAPTIGAYMVHASKLRRASVPILTRYTIKEALGEEKVEGAIIIKLDENWQEIAGSEETLDVDTICLAVGLTPTAELLFQAGCEMRYVAELGGHTPVHDEDLQSTIEGIYVAGDVSGIEEASSAMLEGRLAGVSAAESLVGITEESKKQKAKIREDLSVLRNGPFGEKTRLGKEKMLELWQSLFKNSTQINTDLL